jgi:PqqD family protein of HPr-rel-A system
LQPGAFDSDDQWWIPDADALAWRSWDDEIVLYDDRSDETHHFNVATAAVFETLAVRPASTQELATMLAERLEVRVDDELVAMVCEIVRILREKHIISVTGIRADVTGPR